MDVVSLGKVLGEQFLDASVSYKPVDYPNMMPNLGCSFSFADGRAEIHSWRDKRTTPPVSGQLVLNVSSPNNPDVAWLQEHATRHK